MKTGIAIPTLTPADGGAYTFAAEVLQALDRLRTSISHEIVLCCQGGGTSFATRYSGFPVLDLGAQRKTVLSIWERVLERLPRILRWAVRRVFAVSSWDERVLRREGVQFIIRLVPWAQITLDIPYATTFWDLQHRLNPWFPEVSSLGEWEARERGVSTLLRRASLIFVGLKEQREQISSFYQIPRDRIKVLASPAPTFATAPANNPGKRGKLLVEVGEGDYLFYPAQFWPHKNHAVILEACRVLRQGKNWDLRIVFTGSEKGNEKHIRDYAKKLSLDRYVSFLGLVEQFELVNLYQNAFCLVYPTFCGPEGIPPMEAFALGCPVVASDIPGAREQLAEAALLFKPTDANDLADCILKLRDEGFRQRMIKAGRMLANASSWDEYAKGMIESLDEFSLIRRVWS